MDGLEIVTLLWQDSPETMAIMLTGHASLDSAVGALRRGAYDYLANTTIRALNAQLERNGLRSTRR